MAKMEDKIRSILSHCREVGDLVSCFIDSEDLDVFEVGFVESVGDTTACLRAIDESGESDGRVVCRIDEIERLQVGTTYLKYLKILHESRGKVFRAEPVDLVQITLADMPATLRFAKEQRILVTVQDYEKESLSGFVSELDEDWVEIETILQDGKSDGYTVLQMNDLLRVSVGGKKEQAVGFIHQMRLGR